MKLKQNVETVRLWCRLRNTPGHRIIRRVHEWSLPKSRSWESKMQNFSDSHNIENIMMVENPSKSLCVSTVRSRVIELDIERWHQKLMSNGNAENGNKPRRYK